MQWPSARSTAPLALNFANDQRPRCTNANAITSTPLRVRLAPTTNRFAPVPVVPQAATRARPPPESFTPERLRDARIGRLMALTSVCEDLALSALHPGCALTRMRFRLNDGTLRVKEVQ